MASGALTRVAGGNIVPCTFVKVDTATGKVVTCGAGEDMVGIAQQHTRRAPLTGLDDGYAAIDGEPLEIFCPPDDSALLSIGGTVLPGQLLKSDGTGLGVASTSDKEKVGARALVGKMSDNMIHIRPIHFDQNV